jgi:hypothetical protein
VPQMGDYQRSSLVALQTELMGRRIEALRLYRPTPLQDEFHRCTARERLVIGGNRSGKSLSTFAEDARAATGQDPYEKYPAKDGLIAIVGKDWKHIGVSVYPLLFQKGAFKIIRDLQTGAWRAFDPVLDFGREAERKPAPPLIPPRLISGMTWILKSARYVSRCDLVTGWQIHFFSSEGDPPQGFPADIIHIDEDLNNEDFVGEMQARLADRKGRLYWSAMPHGKNDALTGLIERADAAEENEVENPSIRKFVLPMTANPHIDDEEKRLAIERFSALGEDILRMRVDGIPNSDSVLMYPNWNTAVHVMDRSALPGGVVPDSWCRYVSIDPGHSIAACLFAAVPPDDSMILIYDEMYMRNCNAVMFATELAKRSNQVFRTFIMDMHGGRLTDIGSGISAAQQYSDQMRLRNVRSETTGHAFLAGCDDVMARTTAVRTALHIRGDGHPRLKVLRGAAPNLEHEIKRYKKKVNYVNGVTVVTDMPNTRGQVHACQCLEYIVAHNPRYHKPHTPADPEPWYVRWMKRQNESKGSPYVWLGPQSALA